jgi:hypothetical protein
MRALRWPTLAATLVCLIGCLGDPVGPGGTLVLRRISPLDSVLVGAPGRPLPTPITFEAVDGENRPVRGAAVVWTVAGTNGRVDQAPGVTDARGQLSVVWVLGTRATDPQGLTAQVAVGNHKATLTVSAIAKPIEVSSIAFTGHDDTTMVKLGVATRMTAQATDPFGNKFVPAAMKFVSLDTSLCSVDSLGTVQARKRGFGRLVVVAGSAADTAWVHPTQVVQNIVASPDTLRFHSLGQVANLSVQLLDDEGLSVKDSLPADSVAVDTVAKVQAGNTYAVRSISNGMTPVVLRAGVVARTVLVVVNQKVASVKVSASHSNFDALGDTAQLSVLVSDSLGAPLTNQVLAYSTSDTSVANVGPTGLVTSRGNGSTWIRVRAYNGVADSVAVVVAQQVARVVVKRDSIQFDALQAVLPMQAALVDRLGFPIMSAALTYVSRTSSVATVDATGNIRAIANGISVVTAIYGADTGVVAVHVAQRPVRVLLPSDTARFVALGETQVVQGIAVDSLGNTVTSVVQGLRMTDTTVVQRVDSVTVRSLANGSTTAAFSVAGLPSQLTIVVNQVASSVTAAVTFGKAIVTLPVGAIVPMTCQVLDRNGFSMTADPAVVVTTHGTVGGTCSRLQVQRSGFDTVTFAAGQAQTHVPLLVAASPTATSALGDLLAFDSLPSGINQPWAPTIRLNGRGQVELYVAGYVPPDSSGYIRANLHRLLSNDGINFTYDGVALFHDSTYCSPNGQGIENLAILPRQDSAGLRMLFAGGSIGCTGWQVFSATSTDGKTWIKEAGVRLPNSGIWPTGEGMDVVQLPTGEWQLIAGTFERITPAPTNTWQITEWRSTDQLNWTYVGPVLTTRDMPAAGQGSVYSPTIRQWAPGLWRMIFTADNRGLGTFRSQLWTAVSTDRVHWQIEGPLMGADGSNLYYSSLAGDRLVFVRQDAGGPSTLGIATITMP